GRMARLMVPSFTTPSEVRTISVGPLAPVGLGFCSSVAVSSRRSTIPENRNVLRSIPFVVTGSIPLTLRLATKTSRSGFPWYTTPVLANLDPAGGAVVPAGVGKGVPVQPASQPSTRVAQTRPSTVFSPGGHSVAIKGLPLLPEGPAGCRCEPIEVRRLAGGG